jgi:hypothetical protein
MGKLSIVNALELARAKKEWREPRPEYVVNSDCSLEAVEPADDL